MESFIDLKKETRLPDEELDYVQKNPEGLTKEGIQYNLKVWKRFNRYAAKKYELMLIKCKEIQPSGKLEDGRIILARSPDKGVWAEEEENL